MMEFLRRFSRTRTFDTLAVLPLIVFYAFAVAGLLIKNAPAFRGVLAHFDTRAALDLAAQGAAAAFFALQIALFLRRRPAAAKAQGVLPRAAALLGAGLGYAFVLVPRATPDATLSAVAFAITMAGTVASIVVVFWLDRAFAIFPQARELVTSGPYRFVRHPLYLAELLATTGIALQFAQPWGVLIGGAIVAAQFPRMHYEEQILRETYPAYAAYEGRTARLIPGLY